ncbi:hypothetical protein NQ318_021552 [Aromia moschata]|uniref:Uncharacterized protein n=1 Tax=Aromia moschata TaxID=1265417 RepID=A0AAV8YIQ5_9CUCU|nr:hypothetical protein NQ318_021552 [Aromia moschata]
MTLAAMDYLQCTENVFVKALNGNAGAPAPVAPPCIRPCHQETNLNMIFNLTLPVAINLPPSFLENIVRRPLLTGTQSKTEQPVVYLVGDYFKCVQEAEKRKARRTASMERPPSRCNEPMRLAVKVSTGRRIVHIRVGSGYLEVFMSMIEDKDVLGALQIVKNVI